jgi:hypothetical protein
MQNRTRHKSSLEVISSCCRFHSIRKNLGYSFLLITTLSSGCSYLYWFPGEPPRTFIQSTIDTTRNNFNYRFKTVQKFPAGTIISTRLSEKREPRFCTDIKNSDTIGIALLFANGNLVEETKLHSRIYQGLLCDDIHLLTDREHILDSISIVLFDRTPKNRILWVYYGGGK